MLEFLGGRWVRSLPAAGCTRDLGRVFASFRSGSGSLLFGGITGVAVDYGMGVEAGDRGTPTRCLPREHGVGWEWEYEVRVVDTVTCVLVWVWDVLRVPIMVGHTRARPSVSAKVHLAFL